MTGAQTVTGRQTVTGAKAAASAKLLTGAIIVTVDAQDRVLANHDLRIEGARIAAIGPSGTIGKPGDAIIDCASALLCPGFVNTHTHAATAMFRGLADDLPASFWPPSYRVPGQERFSKADYLVSLKAACGEYLLNGVTTIADRLGGMIDFVDVIEQSGMRAILGESIAGLEHQADWSNTEALIERIGVSPERRVSAGIAPHALDSCPDALLRECARRAERLGARVFIHVAQSKLEVAAVRSRGHSGALACLVAAGLTGPHVVAAHCIYLAESEIEAWPRHAISIAHCPSSNLKIEARTLAIHRLHGKVAIGIGTDWTATANTNDMMAETRLAALTGKSLAGDPEKLTTREMMRMLTIDGARVLGLDAITGSLEPGKRADIVALSLDRLEMTPLHDPVSNIIWSANPRSVRDVFADGEALVRNGKLARAGETALARAHRRLEG